MSLTSSKGAGQSLTSSQKMYKKTQDKRKLKKRRFKEIDNAWDLNVQEDSQSVIAVHQKEDTSDETLSLNSRKGSRRQIKFSYKKINKICTEMDLVRGRTGSTSNDG